MGSKNTSDTTEIRATRERIQQQGRQRQAYGNTAEMGVRANGRRTIVPTRGENHELGMPRERDALCIANNADFLEPLALVRGNDEQLHGSEHTNVLAQNEGHYSTNTLLRSKKTTAVLPLAAVHTSSA